MKPLHRMCTRDLTTATPAGEESTMIGQKLTRGRYLRGAELTMTANDEPRRRRWISLLTLGAAIAVASVYGVATASALESGATVQFLIPADANQPTPAFVGAPQDDFLVYGLASGTIDARGCALGDKPVQLAKLVLLDRGQNVGNDNPRVDEVITTYQSDGGHDATTPVAPGTRVGNLLSLADCSIFVGDTRVDYKKYTGTVK